MWRLQFKLDVFVKPLISRFLVSRTRLVLALGCIALALSPSNHPSRAQDSASTPSPVTAVSSEAVTIELLQRRPEVLAEDTEPRFTFRVTPESLLELMNSPAVPSLLRTERQLAQLKTALPVVSMDAVLTEMLPVLQARLGPKFDHERDAIYVPVEPTRRVEVPVPGASDDRTYRGPKRETVGFLLHDVTESEAVALGIRIAQTARQIFDNGRPAFRRDTEEYLRALAGRESLENRAAAQSARENQADARAVREMVAEQLGLSSSEPADNGRSGNWLKESRKFSYIIREGEFIGRLKPLVDRINKDMEIAGYQPPSTLDRAGIHFDPEIGDVDIVLPPEMLQRFLQEADQLERRIAVDSVISIEAVRLTDRDIVSGALASRLTGQFQGVHDTEYGATTGRIVRETTLNSLLAVANQQLQIATLSGVAGGMLPAGTTPITIAPPTLPAFPARETTTIGTDFSFGADDLFFDGRQQVASFSYLGPDGVSHTVMSEVVDSLREFWDRIERNLIVHKIKRTDRLTEFTVPVGPVTNTYNGIAALISQENQQQVVATGTGAISKIEATAGTWLIIEDFAIRPIPGSSTTLTEEEKHNVEARVLLTMFLRDSTFPPGTKLRLLETRSPQEMRQLLLEEYRRRRTRPVRSGRDAKTYEHIFESRFAEALSDAAYEKKEANSAIALTFYSSQGNIIQQAGVTALGDANDLTSFTTELRPNVVTPISSFFTKSGSGALGTSPLTGVDRGERVDEEKTMTHLLIRARFPTLDRERRDRDEGRHLGYFNLPIAREPTSTVDVPFLSSSEHPSDRLAKLRIGLSFDVLDPDKVRKPFSTWNPNRFPGNVPPDVHKMAMTRYLMMRRIIADSPANLPQLASEYRHRFMVEVRSLLEYDDDFFDAPNFALRNMAQWNDPARIIVALNNTPNRFALARLSQLLDEVGRMLVPDTYVQQNLAVAPKTVWKHRRVYPLSPEQLSLLRRDVAAHYLRLNEAYGDAFLEAISRMLGTGSYTSNDKDEQERAPFRGFQDLVVFDNAGGVDTVSPIYKGAREEFLFLRGGGYEGKGMFEQSRLAISDMADKHRPYVFLGSDILKTLDGNADYRGD